MINPSFDYIVHLVFIHDVILIHIPKMCIQHLKRTFFLLYGPLLRKLMLTQKSFECSFSTLFKRVFGLNEQMSLSSLSSTEPKIEEQVPAEAYYYPPHPHYYQPVWPQTGKYSSFITTSGIGC